MAKDRSYGGVPAEQRRADRRAALLDAALNVVGTDGFNGLSVSGLCRMTGLNDRYFYEHFDNRNAMFVALVDQLADELFTAMATAFASADTDVHAIVHAGLSALVELIANDPRKARVMFVEAPAHASGRRQDVRELFITLMRAQAQLRLGSVDDHVDIRMHFAGVHLFGALLETTTAWLAGELPIGQDELIEQSTDLVVATVEHVLAAAEHAGA
ncbi:TetR/AcrR family transcriptional regulator [Mycobacterium syngnathidarum]